MNSLYRHNFSTLIEELFPNKNNSLYINTENDPSINIYGSNNKQKSGRKDLSSEKRETKNLYDKYTENRSAERRNKNKLYNINNNSLKKRKKR